MYAYNITNWREGGGGEHSLTGGCSLLTGGPFWLGPDGEEPGVGGGVPTTGDGAIRLVSFLKKAGQVCDGRVWWVEVVRGELHVQNSETF